MRIQRIVKERKRNCMYTQYLLSYAHVHIIYRNICGKRKKSEGEMFMYAFVFVCQFLYMTNIEDKCTQIFYKIIAKRKFLHQIVTNIKIYL